MIPISKFFTDPSETRRLRRVIDAVIVVVIFFILTAIIVSVLRHAFSDPRYAEDGVWVPGDRSHWEHKSFIGQFWGGILAGFGLVLLTLGLWFQRRTLREQSKQARSLSDQLKLTRLETLQNRADRLMDQLREMARELKLVIAFGELDAVPRGEEIIGSERIDYQLTHWANADDDRKEDVHLGANLRRWGHFVQLHTTILGVIAKIERLAAHKRLKPHADQTLSHAEQNKRECEMLCPASIRNWYGLRTEARDVQCKVVAGLELNESYKARLVGLMGGGWEIEYRPYLQRKEHCIILLSNYPRCARLYSGDDGWPTVEAAVEAVLLQLDAAKPERLTASSRSPVEALACELLDALKRMAPPAPERPATPTT